jgi:hypothetical protein
MDGFPEESQADPALGSKLTIDFQQRIHFLPQSLVAGAGLVEESSALGRR